MTRGTHNNGGLHAQSWKGYAFAVVCCVVLCQAVRGVPCCDGVVPYRVVSCVAVWPCGRVVLCVLQIATLRCGSMSEHAHDAHVSAHVAVTPEIKLRGSPSFRRMSADR